MILELRHTGDDALGMRSIICAAVLLAVYVGALEAQEQGSMNIAEWKSVVEHHPGSAALKRLFPDEPVAAPSDFKSTGMTRKDYLTLIAGNVDYWKHFQNEAGAIVDPYERDEKNPAGKERQYSTPAFALASAELIQEAGREDLLPYSLKAMSFATAALANHTTADNHADFYIPMLMHAHPILSKVAKSAE